MATIDINGTRIHYEDAGEGPALVLVHGNWDGGDCWDALRAVLASTHRVVSYDRRGHSRSERPAAPWTRRDNEDDLEALIEALGLGGAHVVGNSYGGLVALGLAGRRPDLMSGVSVHEPPAVALLDPEAGADVAAPLEQVLEEIQAGAAERATRRFMDEVALGPGSWAQMPAAMRAALTANAPAFATEVTDPDWTDLALSGIEVPVQVTRGDASPEWLMALAGRLADEIGDAETAIVAGAGHAPHETHPAEYAGVLRAFAREPVQVSI